MKPDAGFLCSLVGQQPPQKISAAEMDDSQVWLAGKVIANSRLLLGMVAHQLEAGRPTGQAFSPAKKIVNQGRRILPT